MAIRNVVLLCLICPLLILFLKTLLETKGIVLAMAKEFKVHHASAEAVLVQLPDGGFGRVTKESLGNDTLAEQMLRQYAVRSTVAATLLRKRDAQGYLMLGLSLQHVWSGVLSYPAAVSQTLQSLFRRNCMVTLGSVQQARVLKTSAKGSIFQLAGGITAVAPIEVVSGGVPSCDVCILSYDASAGGATVTMDKSLIAHVPSSENGAEMLEATSSLSVGSSVSCSVLLVEDDEGRTVVDVATPSGNHIVAYLVSYHPVASKPKYALHQQLHAVVEFTPHCVAHEFSVKNVPFVILSDRAPFEAIPQLRRMIPPTRMSGPFPWRDGSAKAEDERRRTEKRGSSALDDDQPLRKRRMEEAIDAFERDDNTVPKSVEEFQKLLLAKPNSSYLWTQFMAFHMGLQQFEEARLVAEKALRTMGVRENAERLNVWVAYLNLENAQGTAESLTSVFRRALQASDNEMAVHQRLADIFRASKKHQQLLALCRVMTSKYRNFPAVWERLGITLIEGDKRDQLKRMIKDMSGALKTNEQCLVVEHLAIFEYRNDNVANGRALFEGLVSRCPKHSDVWSAFLDQELALLTRKHKEGSVTVCRDLFDRVTTVGFNARVMQQLLTRYLTFEQTHGSPHGVENVKNKARAYVESRISADGGAVAVAAGGHA